MNFKNSNYSPNISIYLEVGETQIRLSDVLYNSATLFEATELPADTHGTLVFLIDGVEEREKIVLQKRVTRSDSLISFNYADPARINGRHFPIAE